MHSLPLHEMQHLVRDVAIRMDEPLMVWGPPGAGKSEAIAQIVAETPGATLIDIRLSQYDSVDLRGIPVPTGGHTVWHAPSTLPFKGNPRFDENGVLNLLFLDEINGATNATSSVAYQLVNEKRVGEHVLMDNVRIVAAGNRETDRGIVNRMALPLANRFTHCDVLVTAESWVHGYAIPKGLPPEAIGFMMFSKESITSFDPASPEKAFATPRTWAKAFRYWADPMMRPSTKLAAIAGAVGEGNAAKFDGFCRVWKDIIPASRIIADPMGSALPSELSLRYATVVNLSGSMESGKGAAKATTKPIHTYLERLDDPELVVLAWQMAMKRDATVMQTPEFLQFAKDYQVMF